MAFKEVDPGPAEPPKNFFKFEAIGDQFRGFYVGYAAREKTFDGKKKTAHEYTFQNKKGVHVIDANYDLGRRLQKAVKDGLKPGHEVAIKYVADLPNENPEFSAMKQFKVLIDMEPKSAPPPPPPPKPADEEDDIKF